jgi:hypothetical protein
MSAEKDARDVARKILEIWKGRRTAAAFALASRYSQVAQQQFFDRQIGDEFWENRTGQALSRVFPTPFRRRSSLSVGFRLSHGVDYGVYLELANNRKHEALRPIVFAVGKDFLSDVRRLLA